MADDWKTTIVEVRAGMEWATFCVRESPVVPREGSGVSASAEWMCNSSFGCFAHYWSSMGQPFGEFIADVDDGYLLGKIGQRVTDSRKVVTQIKQRILQARRERKISKQEALDAMDDLEVIDSEAEGQALCHLVYLSRPIGKVIDDFCDIESQSWDCQSIGFVKQIWPLFVKQFNEQVQDKAA